MHNKRLQLNSLDILNEKFLFLKNCVTSEGAVSHIAFLFNYQQLSIVSF